MLFASAIKSFSPDYISLQYVPYSFDKKGFPLALLRCLGPARHVASWHIMAHELWLSPGGRTRDAIIGFIQKLIGLYIFRYLRPRSIHTSNWWYSKLLEKSGIPSSVLPIFSNIPFCPSHLEARNPSEWKFLLFGSINRDWKHQELLCRIEVARQFFSIKQVSLVTVGNIGDYGAHIWSAIMNDQSYRHFHFCSLGELSPESISAELQKATFGISVTPSHLVQKSGSVAAMLSHGLPVIVSRVSPGCDKWHQFLKSSGRFILLDDSFESSLGSVSHFPPASNLEDTATQLISDLDLAT
jgi:hypothetical protein